MAIELLQRINFLISIFVAQKIENQSDRIHDPGPADGYPLDSSCAILRGASAGPRIAGRAGEEGTGSAFRRRPGRQGHLDEVAGGAGRGPEFDAGCRGVNPKP